MNREVQLMDKYQQLSEMIAQSERIVFFGGAGVSTESGLPDYRSKDGKYTAMRQSNDDPKKIMHIDYLMQHPEKFFAHYVDDTKAEPNRAHHILAKWERTGKTVDIITQNVDSLHQQAGSMSVIELHGDNRSWYCMDCGHTVAYTEVHPEAEVPYCKRCGGLMRPNVIYFGEMPDRHVIEQARNIIAQGDLLLIAGTSLTVSPARYLIRSFAGTSVVVINTEAIEVRVVPVDLCFQAPVGQVLEVVDTILEKT
jgi:sir2 family NAD-dependent deacetylase